MGPFDRHVGRRTVLELGVACVGSALAPRLFAQAPAPSVIVRNPRPLCLESRLDALRTLETPNASFFVRSHLHFPSELGERATLTIDGDVAHRVVLSFGDIRRMRAVRRLVTLECAGNGRGRFPLPSTSGLQWDLGAVGTATFTAVPLAEVVERAGLRDTARHLWMEAADAAPLATTPRFLRSLPRDVALAEALVAYEMNGEPIALRHGGPLRLVVPGWYGMAWTKWLTHIHARPVESDNFFHTRGYRYPDGVPVTRIAVKSVITTPLAGARVPTGSITVSGAAWTGTGSVRVVELSSDGGASWTEARFTTAEASGAWRQFEGFVSIDEPGDHVVCARATDTSGTTQPEHATPNPAGYANNSIHAVRIHAFAP